jgi:hypothetical protein
VAELEERLRREQEECARLALSAPSTDLVERLSKVRVCMRVSLMHIRTGALTWYMELS